MHCNDIKQKIQSGLPGAFVEVLSDDNVHFQAIIKHDGFQGLSKVAQHRMVYACLGDSFDQGLHALQISTYDHKE